MYSASCGDPKLWAALRWGKTPTNYGREDRTNDIVDDSRFATPLDFFRLTLFINRSLPSLQFVLGEVSAFLESNCG